VDKTAKQEAVKEIEDLLSRCTIAILTDYRGLTVADMSELRGKLRGVSSEYRVVKNTMTRFAAERTGKEALKDLLVGPTAIVFGYGEVMEPAKALADYLQAKKLGLPIKGGIMGDRLLSPEQIKALATMPPREVLISRLLGMLQTPITSLVFTLNANLSGLVRVLDARRQQLEGA
jgi:large subunit ribosomal protein L10